MHSALCRSCKGRCVCVQSHGRPAVLFPELLKAVLSMRSACAASSVGHDGA